jgi:hypothetical protein
LKNGRLAVRNSYSVNKSYNYRAKMALTISGNATGCTTNEEVRSTQICTPQTLVRINAGGPDFTTATKKLFIADKYYPKNRSTKVVLNSKETGSNSPQLVIQTTNIGARLGQEEVLTEIQEKQQSTVFPNPAKDQFTVSLSVIDYCGDGEWWIRYLPPKKQSQRNL